MKRMVTIIILVLLSSWTILFACEFDYTVVDQTGKGIQVIPGQPVTLELGKSYAFEIAFYEDHRNCVVPPADTLLMIDGARWRVSRESQGLVLGSMMEWQEYSSRLNTGSTTFTALIPGTYSIEVVRVCDRGGYTAELIFIVTG